MCERKLRERGYVNAMSVDRRECLVGPSQLFGMMGREGGPESEHGDTLRDRDIRECAWADSS